MVVVWFWLSGLWSGDQPRPDWSWSLHRVSITSLPGTPTKPIVQRFTDLTQQPAGTDSVVHVDHSSVWIYAPDVNFVHADPSVEATYRSVFPQAEDRMQVPQ